MQEQQVDVVHAQVAQGVLGRGAQLPGAEVARPDLRGDPDLVALHARFGDRAPDLLLVLVGTGRVDVAIADLERVAHAVVGVVALHEPGPEAQARDPGTLDGQDGAVVVVLHGPADYPQRAPAHLRGMLHGGDARRYNARSQGD